jgi:hypothetical protein
MANNTDAGLGPGSGDVASRDAWTADANFDIGGSALFGSPDQRLYGGTQVGSPTLEPAIAASGPGYQGRHRAAD